MIPNTSLSIVLHFLSLQVSFPPLPGPWPGFIPSEMWHLLHWSHSSVDLLGFFSGGLQKSVLVHFPRFSWAGLWIQGLLCAGTAPGSGTWEDWEIQAGSSSVALIPKRDSPQILSAQPLANYLHYFSPSFTHLAWKQSHAQLWFFGITSQGCLRDLALFGIVISICPPPKQLFMIFIPIKHWHSLGASPWFQILCIWFWLWLPEDFFFFFCACSFILCIPFPTAGNVFLLLFFPPQTKTKWSPMRAGPCHMRSLKRGTDCTGLRKVMGSRNQCCLKFSLKP